MKTKEIMLDDHDAKVLRDYHADPLRHLMDKYGIRREQSRRLVIRFDLEETDRKDRLIREGMVSR